MKKKLLVVKLIALCIALVLAMGLVLTACGEDSMIRPNKERTAKQAAAVVNYGGRQAYVDKTSVLTSFYNYYNTIYQYYQMGYISADQFTAIADNLQDTFSRSPKLRFHFLYLLRQLRLTFRFRRAIHIMTHALAVHRR